MHQACLLMTLPTWFITCSPNVNGWCFHLTLRCRMQRFGETLYTEFFFFFSPSGHLTSVLCFKGHVWTFLKVSLIKGPSDSRGHKNRQNKKTKRVRRQSHIWHEQILLSGNVFDGWTPSPSPNTGSIQILAIHASADCSMRKKQPLICCFSLRLKWSSSSSRFCSKVYPGMKAVRCYDVFTSFLPWGS